MRMIGAVLTASALLLAGGYAARMLSLTSDELRLTFMKNVEEQ